MKVPAIVICLLLRLLSIAASRVYSCPTGCRCTILKRQRDRVTAATSEQSVAPGRKVVCQSSSPLITSVSQIPLDNLPRDTLHLYVVWRFIFLLSAVQSLYSVLCVKLEKGKRSAGVESCLFPAPPSLSLLNSLFFSLRFVSPSCPGVTTKIQLRCVDCGEWLLPLIIMKNQDVVLDLGHYLDYLLHYLLHLHAVCSVLYWPCEWHTVIVFLRVEVVVWFQAGQQSASVAYCHTSALIVST